MVWGVTAEKHSQLLIAPSLDHSVYVWNASAKYARRRLDGHADEVWRVSTLQNRRVPMFVTASLDGTVRVWSLPAGGEASNETIFAGRAMVTALASDDREFAHGDKAGHIRLWEYTPTSIARKGSWELGDVMVQALAFAPDRSLLAATDDGMMHMFYRATLGSLHSWRANNGSVIAIAMRDDGTLVTSGYNRIGIREPWDLQLWQLGSRELASSSSAFGTVTALAFDRASDRLLLAGLEGRIFVLELPGWRVVDALIGHASAVHALHVLDDGRILSGGADHSVLLWKCMDCSEYEAEANRTLSGAEL
mmetsp:Transcript_30400/g.61170  ORF Transcript_30400/g.61170 Transcript_30400/m.61170 type:complete len:307 (-) Transcript_30400:142-1062(-)